MGSSFLNWVDGTSQCSGRSFPADQQPPQTVNNGHRARAAQQLSRQRFSALADERASLASSIESDVRRNLIEAIGIDNHAYELSMANIGLTIDAQAAVERLILDADKRIGGRLQHFTMSARDKLDSTVDALKVLYADTDGAIGLIDQIDSEFRQLLPVLTFQRDGLYSAIINENIGHLEVAAQADNGLEPGEQELLEQLRRHAQMFADAPSAGAAIQSIEVYLDRTDLPNVVRLDGSRKPA